MVLGNAGCRGPGRRRRLTYPRPPGARPRSCADTSHAAALDKKGLVRELGWGTAADDAAPPAQVLRQLDVAPLASSACDSGQAPIGIDEVCLDHAPGGGGACHGDSGTAAFQRVDGRRWAAGGSAGRTGAGRSVPCSQSPAVYTNLAYYAAWFRQHQQVGQ
ncbi:trypsin-like serine protease [Amycolatopsis mongoliensis]|uniref:trypsin-like serine protease n=1 Tax=Amycolatopsis mongoliensis TaxID=715475 RepID=UPI0038CC0B3B